MLKIGIRFRNIGGTRDESILQGQAAKGGFHDAGKGKSMTGEGFGAGNSDLLRIGENLFESFDLRCVPNRRGGCVCIDIFDG